MISQSRFNGGFFNGSAVDSDCLNFVLKGTNKTKKEGKYEKVRNVVRHARND